MKKRKFKIRQPTDFELSLSPETVKVVQYDNGDVEHIGAGAFVSQEWQPKTRQAEPEPEERRPRQYDTGEVDKMPWDA